MSATTKYEFHPDVESLSAFAEQALPERERSQVLAHLASCGRCRQVVALAREAAEAEAVTAPRPRAIQSNAWWNRWRLVWVPSAVLAAFAVASVSFYIHQADQSGARVEIAEQPNEQNDNRAAPSSQPEEPEAAPAAPRAKAAPPPPPNVPPNSHPSQAVATRAVPPPPAATEQVEVATEEPALVSGAEPSGLAAKRPAPEDKPAAAASPSPEPGLRASREEKEKQEDRRRQPNAAESPALAAIPAAASAPPADNSSSQSQNEAAAASSRQFEMRSGSLSGVGAMKSSQAKTKGANPAMEITLPSGLAAVSSASSSDRMIAVDKAGALFLSLDSGNIWEPIARQWTGRAVHVRIRASSNAAPAFDQLQEAPASPGGSPEPAPASSPTPSPALEPKNAPSSAPNEFFEILNDKDQVWLSTDGRLWIAK